MLTNWEIIQLITIWFSTLIPLLVLFFTIRYYKKSDKRKEQIMKIEKILTKQNELFNKFTNFYQKWFSFKDRFYNDYTERNLTIFINELNYLEKDFSNIDSELNVMYHLYLKDYYDEYIKFSWPMLKIIFELNNIIEMPIWWYWDLQIKEFQNKLTDNDKEIYKENIKNNPYKKIKLQYDKVLHQTSVLDDILKKKWLELFNNQN